MIKIKNTNFQKIVNISAAIFISFITTFTLFSCADSEVVRGVQSEKLFTLDYGKFDNQIDLFSVGTVGNINTFFTMHNGFFYIANGESKKIMELNSYGDLLTLYFNEETGLIPEFEVKTDSSDSVESTRKAISYPFSNLGPIAVDSKKTIYVVDTLPVEQQISGTDENLLLKQVVLRFAIDGRNLDYLGQQGIGGTPFPYVKNIYTTSNDELVIVCITNEGLNVYWFNSEGQLLYVIPIRNQDLPNPFNEQGEDILFVTADNVIPSSTKHSLYIKVDYFGTHVDQDSKVQSGIDYKNTLLYSFDVTNAIYEEPIKIPPYEEEVSDGFGKVTYSTPYEFLGVTATDWKFFSLPVDDGYMIQMVQPGGQRILTRKIQVDSDNLLYYTFSLSENGILSALFAYPDNAAVEWWRIDSLIENLTEE